MHAQMKLNSLNQYIARKPKQVIDKSNFRLIGTEEAYQSAKSLLQERYGHCNVIGSAFKHKIKNWLQITLVLEVLNL